MNLQKNVSSSLNLRAKVILLLTDVQNGVSLQQVLNQQLHHIAEKDRALFHELVLGTLRQWFALKTVALPLLEKELNNSKVETALYVGLYQILCTNIAQHAIISETVEAVKQLDLANFSGLVNAILRRATREKAHFQTQLQQAHGLPSWLFKRLKKDWGVANAELFQVLKQTAPLTLRVNSRHVSCETYLNELKNQQIRAEKSSLASNAICLKQAVNIPKLFGFTDGLFSVQDEHAQLCTEILPDLKDKIVLDACTAPGGKACAILEKYDVKQLIAIDNEAKRLNRVHENLQRLKLNNEKIQVLCEDATTYQTEQRVDCIVLDAPCTATGVMRRHPDIRLLRKSEDVEQTVKLQKQILENMWKNLATGGHLLYITCSILKAENEQQMTAFFARHQNAREIKLPEHWGITQQYGRQLLPTENGGDGFYYCLIEKI